MGFFLRRGSFGTFLSPRREKYTHTARKQGERRREQAPALQGTEECRRNPAKEPLPAPPYGERKNGGGSKPPTYGNRKNGGGSKPPPYGERKDGGRFILKIILYIERNQNK